tara:strand:+ start:102 stop:308 length:207 start_codon:yes stop_codon:yes gene_type:complete
MKMMKLMTLMTAPDVAQYMQLKDVEAIRKAARAGALDGSKIGGEWRFYRADVDEWVKSLRPYKKAGKS